MSLVNKLMQLATKLDSEEMQLVINASVTISSLKMELKQAEDTLTEIKNLDYRGNREQGSVIAFRYFENQK